MCPRDIFARINLMAGKHIVFIEDDPFILDLGVSRIERAGYKLTHFTTADEALPKIAELRPDVILLDLILPGMDGYQFLEKVKADEATKSIPVVILSNLGSESEIQRGINLGADAYLVKSNTKPSEILSKIKEVLARVRKE